MENQPEQTQKATPPGLTPAPSKVISRLTHFITCVIFGGFAVDFFSRGAIKPISQINILYTSLLTAYAGEKEVRRWNALIPQESQGGKGDSVVSLWLLFYIFCWALASLKPVYRIPPDLLTACLSVLSIFFGSKVSKRFYQGRLRKSDFKADLKSDLGADLKTNLGEETAPLNNNDRIEVILDYLKENGKITREDVVEILGVAGSTARRLLKTLANEDRIKWVGRWEKDPDGYYTLP